MSHVALVKKEPTMKQYLGHKMLNLLCDFIYVNTNVAGRELHDGSAKHLGKGLRKMTLRQADQDERHS